MNKLILFDLENTLIFDWFDDPRSMIPTFPAIREWVLAEREFIAGMFSFAVLNEKDVSTFNQRMRTELEDDLSIMFIEEHFILKQHLLDSFRRILKMPFLTFDDLSSFLTKRDMILKLWEDGEFEQFDEVVLLDDTVEDMTITANDNKILRFVNPWTIIREN